ncbi:hypothetical protein LCGC14_1455350 [marine sediment metagenome]|uniref:Uncharacterized protein n=1 Tax=marine sediment metagenome TaxID=412755 RepID=A0A0F9K2U5_9ZZZZ
MTEAWYYGGVALQYVAGGFLCWIIWCFVMRMIEHEGEGE